MQSRRKFLHRFLVGSGCFTASACGWSPLISRSVRPETYPFCPHRFPQGVASADPQPDAVMLWVRVAPLKHNSQSIPVRVQLADDRAFSEVILESSLWATAESDHTLRFFAQGLKSDHRYYYRFVYDDTVSSPIGRTRTAPAIKADRKVNFAWACCQNFEDGFYGSWARMIQDDKQAIEENKLDFILHVGDFIYETINSGFRDENTRALYGTSPYLKYRSGAERRLSPLPSGGVKGKYGGRAATNLADYRHIYKEYLKDPNLQAARARWPFICMWDDHEFGDNCWQSHLGNVANQKGRLAANQAWYEYIPALLDQTRVVDGLQGEAHEFKSSSVEDVPFGGPGEASPEEESNNQAAIHSIQIYRSLRYGRHLKLILTDNRSFRSDHAIPEWWELKYFPDKTLQKTANLVDELDLPPERSAKFITVDGVSIPNPRINHAPGSILGGKQKEWWMKCVKNTDATWKVWANSVPLMSLRYDKRNAKDGGPLFSMHSDDMWDGYPTERQELLQFIEDNEIENIVSLSGDLHAHIAGAVCKRSGNDSSKTLIPEFVVAGVSSVSMYRILRMITSKASLFYDEVVGPESSDFPMLNNTLINGGRSSLHIDTKEIEKAGVSTNSNLDYVDTDATGYGLVQLDGEGMRASLVTMANPLVDMGEEVDKIARLVTYDLYEGQREPKVCIVTAER